MRSRVLPTLGACLVFAMAATAQNTNTNSNTNTDANSNTNANGNTSNTNSSNSNTKKRNKNSNSNTNSNSNSNSNTNTNSNSNSNSNTNSNANDNTMNMSSTSSGTNSSRSTPNVSPSNNGSGMATASMGGSVAALDQKFIMDAAMGNNAEIQMGQLAVQKATTPEVKQFAQMMIDQHTAANAQLAQNAQAMGMTLPTGVAPNHQAVMTGMQNLSGTQFDMAYVKQQLGDHAATRDMYEMARKDGKDKGAKDYAKKTLPTVEQHYDQLKAMDMRMSPMATAMAPSGQ